MKQESVTDNDAAIALVDTAEFAAIVINEALASGVLGKGSLAGKLTEAANRLQANGALVRGRFTRS